MSDPFALKGTPYFEVILMMKNRFDDLAQLIAEFSQLYADYAKKYNLNFNELHFLYYIGRNKTAHPNEISKRWSIPKQTINSMIRKFQQEKILQVTNDPHDGRKKVLSLTASGQQFIAPLLTELTAAELATQAENEAIFTQFLTSFTKIKQDFAKELNQQA